MIKYIIAIPTGILLVLNLGSCGKESVKSSRIASKVAAEGADCANMEPTKLDYVWNTKTADQPDTGIIEALKNNPFYSAIAPKIKSTKADYQAAIAPKFRAIKVHYKTSFDSDKSEMERIKHCYDYESNFPPMRSAHKCAVTITYTPMSGGLISMATGQQCEGDRVGDSAEKPEYYQSVGLAGIYGLAIKRSIPPVLPPVKGAVYALDYGTRNNIRYRFPTEALSFEVCTWGDTISGAAIGVVGQITETSCVASEKETTSYGPDKYGPERKVIRIRKSKKNWWFLQNYGIFIKQPKDESSFSMAFDPEKEASYTNSIGQYKTNYSDFGVEVIQ